MVEHGAGIEGLRSGVGPQRQVGHQADVAGLFLPRHDHAAGHTVDLVAASLDLAGLDAVAPHLQLKVQPAQVLQQAVVAPAAAVAGAVDRDGAAEDPGGDEAFGRQVGTMQVARRDAGAGDADLAGHADRAGLLVGVEDPDTGVGDRPADGHAARGDHLALHVPGGGPDGGFGRAVDVPHLRAAVEQVERQRAAHGLAPDPAAKAGGARPAGVAQQLPGAGRGLEDGHLFLLDQAAQAGAVHGGFALHHYDLGPGGQRQQQLGHGDVERQRGHGGQPVGVSDAGRGAHRLDQVGHGAVRYAHALGPAGGARGVDDVGEVVGPGVKVVVGRERVARCLLPGGVGVDVQDAPGRVGAPAARRGRDARGGQQQPETGVLGMLVEPRLRKAGVQRHVGRAGLEDGQQCHDHVDAALQAQAHALAASHAAVAQRAGQLVGPCVELAVAAALGAVADGGALRQQRRAGDEAGMGEGPALQPGGRRLQRHEGVARFRRQQTEPAHRRGRVLHRRAQQGFEHAEPALHARLVEQVGVVLGLGDQAAVQRAQVEGYLEVLVAPGHRFHRRVEAGECLRPAADVGVDVEHHARQWQPPGIAPQRELAEECAVGQRLVLEGAEHRAGAVAQQRVEAHARIHADAQRQQVHAVADQARHLVGQLTRRRYADHDVVLAGQPVQRGDEAAEEPGEQAHAVLRAGRAQGAHELPVEGALCAARGEGPHLWPQPVGRQVEHR
ncbi:MAG: hypothetical protein GAK38_01525 [Xylophilus sp.]|nr:MAG: hypothetical protein GAK38_01525 [Xylophilus sp.]